MNYKLAKQLKDAGFKDSKDWEEDPYFHSGKMGYFDEGFFEHPTLSELIEAIREGEDGMLILAVEKKSKGNYASAGIQGLSVNGKTPEESVAKLWLKLQEKD